MTTGLNSLRQRADWQPRPDAPAKAAGLTRFMTDLSFPDMLHAAVLRSPHAHGRIVRLDVSAAQACPGVAAVVTHKTIPGLNGFGIINPHQPVLAVDRVRYRGEAIALVAAATVEQARAAVAAIELEIAPLPDVSDAAASLAETTALLHASGNLAHRESFAHGDAEAVLADCPHVVEATYTTPAQWAAPLETEGGVAVPQSDGTLLLYVGSQAARRDREQLARILARPAESFRIVSSPTGGAFGAKDELTVQHHLALLALHCGRPVRLHWHRSEAALAAIHRHPYRIHMRTGCDAAGRILAHTVDILADTGAYDSLGPTVLFNSVEHAAGPYRIEHVAVDARLVYTTNGVAGACRGFGVPQINFALERQVDALAAHARLEPVEIRRRNLRRPHDPGPFGQTVARSDGARETLAALLEGPVLSADVVESSAEVPTDRWLRGRGVACAFQCDGLGRGLPDPCAAALTLLPDGMVEFALGLEEFGQGTVAAARLLAARALDLAPAQVSVRLGDTDIGLDSGSTTASRATSQARLALERLAPLWRQRLREVAARISATELETLACDSNGAVVGPGVDLSLERLARGMTPAERAPLIARFGFPETPDGPPKSHLTFAYTACACRVAVDRLTGAVRVEALDVATHCGPVADPLGYQGQMEGAAVMALGWALLEDAPAGPTNFDGYDLAGFEDAPRISVIPCENLPADDHHAAVGGAGEIGFDAVAPAIAAAIENATGFVATDLPLRPRAILDWLDQQAAPDGTD